MFEPPFEALRSRYSRSVLAAYASSCAILVRLRAYQARYPALFEKYIIFGLHAFDAAILLGTMAATTPSCPLAASALIEFGKLEFKSLSPFSVRRSVSGQAAVFSYLSLTRFSIYTDQSIPMFVNSKTTIRSRRRIVSIYPLPTSTHLF